MAKLHCPLVIGIASGKGGVGKTSTAVNLAVALAKTGQRTLLLDADMGLANAQIALGVKAPYNLSHLLSGDKTIEQIIYPSQEGVQLIPGASGRRDMAAVQEAEVATIVRALDPLVDQFDALIVDVAAGLSPAVTAFMAACHRRFIVVRDEPSSIADAYGTIKVLCTEQSLDQIYLVPNMVPSQADGQRLFHRLNDITLRFLGHSLHYLHAIEEDELMLTAWRQYRSVVNHAPGSAAARDFRQLAKHALELGPLSQITGGTPFFLTRLLDLGL
jgi:flagellar biosynthesis protein FlhG